MRLGVFVIIAGIAALSGGCGGTEGEADARVDAPSSGCSDSAPCATGFVCIASACVATACGDGVVDAVAGEACDDGNETAFDGCEPATCAFTCDADATCDDSFDCNGTETCDAAGTHACVAGPALGEGAACVMNEGGGDGVCRGTLCVPPGCGNGAVEGTEQCDDMNMVEGDGCDGDCSFSCTTDVECTDGDVCTGEETCDLGTHTCVAGTAVTCDDGDACTSNECDAALGCQFALIDGDGDGHAPTMPGVCGDDCDDMNPLIYAGAEELCDGINNDCDAMIDETAPLWYVDCDNDNYAASTDSSQRSCDEPAPTGCGGGWTNTRPIDLTTTDCHDNNSSVHPGVHRTGGIFSMERYYTSPYTPVGGGSSYDYNCDGTPSRQYGCVSSSTACTSCPPSSGPNGFLCSFPLACGATGSYSACDVPLICGTPPCTGPACGRNTMTRTQGCR